MRDLYHLPFIKVKIEINQQRDLTKISSIDASYKQDYATKASTFLLIAYDKLKTDKLEVPNAFNASSHPKNFFFPDTTDTKQQHLFWANISSEQTVFLWHKFLHLFEKHPCDYIISPISSSQPPTVKFANLLLKTIQEIVDEILKVGHGFSHKKLHDMNVKSRKYTLTYKEIEGIWGKAIYPRRIDKTKCEECEKKFSKMFASHESSPFFNKQDSLDMILKYSNSDNDEHSQKTKEKIEGKNNELSISPKKQLETPSKKEAFEKELQKKSFHKSSKGNPKKSFNTKENYLKNRAHDNNKYIFCKHKVAKGDDILAIFSKWLFELGSLNLAGYEELNLLSIQILSKIFRKSRGPFKEDYLLKFYCLLLENLNKEESSGFLKICVKLFEVNLPNTYYIMREFIIHFSVDRIFKNMPARFLDIYSKYISRFACSYLGRLKYIEEFEAKFNQNQYFSLDFWINHVLECLKVWDKKEKETWLKTVNWIFSIHSVNKARFHSVASKIFSSCKENNKQIKVLLSLKMMRLCFNIMLTIGEVYHLKRSRMEKGLTKEELKDIKLSLEIFFDELDLFLKKFDIKVNYFIHLTAPIFRQDSQRMIRQAI